MVIEFIHTADLHLGSRLNTVGAESGKMQKKLQQSTYSAFENIVEACIEEDVDFLVISGDIYDEDSRSVKANQFLAEQMKKLHEEGIEAYIIHGNHDPVNSGEEFIEMPDNVHVFDSEESEKIDYNDEIEIIGQSYSTRHERRKMVPSFNPDNSKISIGLLHTELDPDNTDYVPVSLDELTEKNIDYWALGHIHQTQVYEDNIAAYPGIPQGRHIMEKGVGGCLKVEISENSSPVLEFIPVSPISWREQKIDIEENDFQNLTDIEDEASNIAKNSEADFEEIESQGLSVKSDGFELEGFIYRWKIEDRGSIHSQLEDDESIEVLRDNLRNKSFSFRPFVWTEEIKDRSRPLLPEIEDIEENEVIQGFEELANEIEEGSEVKQELKKESGKIWRETDDEDNVKEERLALTEDKFDELVERAEEKLKDELLRRTV